MKKKSKYGILILGILGFTLLCYNKYFALAETSLEPSELEFSKWFFGIGILSVGIFTLKKKLRNVFIKTAIVGFGVCLILNIYVSIQIYESIRIGKIYAEYRELDTCEKMEKRFATDLKNNEIKYFQFGFGYDIELDKTLKNKYQIESFGMGCSIQSEMICYNKMVNDYLKDKHNEKIIDFWE